MSAGVVAAGLLATLILGATAQAAKYYTKHDKRDERRGEPDEGHALVYTLRPGRMGAANRIWVFADDQLMMVSKGRTYSLAQVPAGRRLFWAKAELTSELAMNVEAGETYYLKVRIATWSPTRFKLFDLSSAKAMPLAKIQRIDETEAQDYFQKCRYVEPTEAGFARAVEIAADRRLVGSSHRERVRP